MERNQLINIALVISLGLHFVLVTIFFLPDKQYFSRIAQEAKDSPLFRDIIVNVNQDDRKKVTRRTLLSNRDSRESGHITMEKGDRWLNNSRYFAWYKGRSGKKQGGGSQGKGEKILAARESTVYVTLGEHELHRQQVERKLAGKITIPDRNNITRKNAIFYSTSGIFSFNTKKFKQYDYFRRMKDRIAANWFPPLMANSYILGYAPGRTRIMAIPSQQVKIFFTLNRKGKVLQVVLVDSMGSKPLDDSCLDAIRNSKTFGPVPQELEGDVIGIPFIFGYYVQ